MQKTCANSWCGQSYEVTDDDLAFYEKVSPVFNGKKELIPPPTCCPDCRSQCRFAFRNEETLYRRTCDATGRDIVSCYSPNKALVVYERSHWLTIDNTELGQEFDFNRPFFDQFRDLYLATPKASVMQSGEITNSDYTHFVGWVKNCYLTFDSGKDEDCFYCYTNTAYSKNCCDGFRLLRCELCFDSVNLTDCYNTRFAGFCVNCSDSAFLRDCIGCKRCIGCTNLRNKEYHIFNESVTKEEFDRVWSELFSGSYQAVENFCNRWQSFSVGQPHRNLHNIDAKGCTGDYLVRCENVYDSYDCSESKDMRYCQHTENQAHDCYDISSFGESMEFCYELASTGGALGRSSVSNCAFGVYIYYGGNNVYYSMNCHDNCQNCFGCCDVRAKKYCILNKQYSKEEYETIVPKIIDYMRSTGEWGQFFPLTLSQFGYNETLSMGFFPLTKEEVLKKGWHWSDYEAPISQVKKKIPARELPDSLNDLTDDFLDIAIECQVTGKPFRIIKQELDFYRQMGIPCPRLCPDARHRRHLASRNPRKLWGRSCAKCGKVIQTTYAPERLEMVYCEECYLKEVY